ncbi:MAG: hypothetical protein ABI037_09045 [Gemmatimonadales bacterium]
MIKAGQRGSGAAGQDGHTSEDTLSDAGRPAAHPPRGHPPRRPAVVCPAALPPRCPAVTRTSPTRTGRS